jgi:WD repeat-containing protein 68
MESGRKYAYEATYPAFAMSWASRPEVSCRLALGSVIEGDANRIQVLELNEKSQQIEVVAEDMCQFPPTKLMWRPDSPDKSFDLLAASSTIMSIMKLEDGKLVPVAKLANQRTAQGPGHLPPITSFDWSTPNQHKIGCSSVDTTCTIWNVERQKIETQLIAHDKAVYDIAFAQLENLFTSVGADGSVRLFDQRNLDHSTIIYETTPTAPLLRVAWNKLNTNIIAAIALDSVGVITFDIRRPSTALKELVHNDSCINSICWSPHTRDNLLCGTSCGTALIWDMKDSSLNAKPVLGSNSSSNASCTTKGGAPCDQAKGEPVVPVAYECGEEILQVQWPAAQPDYVALGTSHKVEVVSI